MSWMAGLLYLPRIFVYHAEQIENNSQENDVFIVMERKLFHFIMNKAMLATWFFGLTLLVTPGIAGFGVSYWIYLKILCVIAMTGYHIWLGKRQDDFESGANTIASKTYRMLNEVPAVLMVLIVIFVVVKPF